MNSISLRILSLLGCLLLLASCATVDKRIQANARIFATYSPAEQENIRAGNIALGYTMKMVEIAKGPPNYIHLKQDSNGAITIWRYMRFNQYTRSMPAYDVGTRGTAWVNVTETEEVEILRVEFADEKVISIEEMQP
jgi:hypothetical protein